MAHRPSSTPELLRSWSVRSARLCLSEDSDPNSPKTLAEEVANRDPGTWQDAYLKNLRTLFADETVPFDVAFQVGSEIVVKGHRCILEARKFNQTMGNSIKHPVDAGDTVIVDEAIFKKNPEQLRSAVAACYGVVEPNATVAPNISSILEDLSKLDPKNSRDETPVNPPPDVQIVGSPEASQDTEIEWTVEGHMAILCANSDYFRSAQEWKKAEEDEGNSATQIRLDSNQFTLDLVKELVSACYGMFNAAAPSARDGCGGATTLSGAMQQERPRAFGKFRTLTEFSASTSRCIVRQQIFNASAMQAAARRAAGLPPLEAPNNTPKEVLENLIQGATYLGMQAASLCYESILVRRLNLTNVAEMMTFADENGAQGLRLGCHKFLCLNLRNRRHTLDSRVHDGLLKLKLHHLRAVLQSNFLQTLEDELLEIVLQWSRTTRASKEDTKELVAFIRLPFVPAESQLMRKAVGLHLVSEDMLRVCRLFQTDGDYRATMMNGSTMFRPRLTPEMKGELHRKVYPPPPPPGFEMLFHLAGIPVNFQR